MVEATTVKIVVEINRNAKGAIKSTHRPLTPEDKAQLEDWPSGGLVHVSHALFIEALRREAYTTMITLLSQSEEQELTVEGLDAHIRTHWTQMMDKFGKSAAQEALKILG